LEDLLIENNRIRTEGDPAAQAGCYSFGTGAGGYPCPLPGVSQPFAYPNLVFRRNLLLGPATGNKVATFDLCQNCVIESNVMEGTQNGTVIAVSPDHFTDFQPTCRTESDAVTVRNNTVHAPGGDIGISVVNEGSNHVVENNAVWTTGSSCLKVTQPVLRLGNNYCRTNGGAAASAIWVDAANRNFVPANPGPLIGTANQSYYSTTAIGSATWSPTNTAATRSPPIDIGAIQH
jgi:hypothetical protein